MILYHTSPATTVRSSVACPHGYCHLAGLGGPHVCVATEPLAGLGPHVHAVDVPEAMVSRWEYTNGGRTERARFFAIPADVAATLTWTHQEFTAMVGRPWNQWTIPILDRRPSRENPRFRGKWGMLWASRPGIITARVHRQLEDVIRLLHVELAADFDPTRDYLIHEIHDEFDRDRGTFKETKETWKFQAIAGTVPAWAIFPTAWRDWVFDTRVRQSAAAYITQHAPALRNEVAYALRMETKHNLSRAGRDVADRLNRVLTTKLGTPVDLGKFPGHSMTAAMAILPRIANRMSTHLPYEPWTPPRPQPEFENPEDSGRYLLANLYGVYPTKGPGVDHKPQDRPFTGLEGELRPEDEGGGGRSSFSVRQAGPAPALT